MASTFSPLKVELIATGEQSGTWGTTTNVNLGTALGEAITGSADVTFASGDVTVTLTNVNTTQIARNLRLNLVGTSSGTHSLILGSGCDIEKLYLVNNTLADPVIVVNTAGGTSITVPAGKSMFVYNTGTNIVDAVTHVTSLTSGTITGTTITASTGFTGALTGNAATATTLQTARLIGGVSFNGSADINLPGVNQTGNQNTTGSAATLTTARTINGTSFNGSANITTANWGTARTLWGQSVNGSANITAPLLPAAGTAAAPAFSTSGDTNTGVFFPAADTLAFAEGGAEAMRIDSAGNVGIGTTTPTAKISVAGTGGFTGSVTAPTFIGDLTGNAATANALRKPSVNPTLDLDFANNDYTIYDSFANSYTDKPYADMLTVTNGVATGFDAIGVLRNSVANNIRLVFDPETGVSQGALVEPAATNLLLRSEEFDNASWGKTRSSITANTIVAPDGTLTGDSFVIDTTAATTHALAQSVSVVSGTSYTFSIHAKSKEISQINMRFNAGFPTGNVTFDLVNGTLGTGGTIDAATITPVGNGWYRCSFTQTANATLSVAAQIFLAVGNSITIASANGFDSVFVWGAQLETGSVPTSYIKTEASTVTRVADVINRTTGLETNVLQGTIFTEFISQNLGNSVVSLGNNTAVNRIRIGVDSSGNILGQVFVGSVTQALLTINIGGTGESLNKKVKAAITYKENEIVVYANGIASSVDNTASIPQITTLRLGNAVLAQQSLIGTISKIELYPRALTEAECIALTTL
jgi:uncharacterized protein (DUF2164 family)